MTVHLNDKAMRISGPITSDRPGVCGHCGERFDRGAQVVAAITESDAQRIWCLQDHTTVPVNVTRPDQSSQAGAAW